MRYDLACFLCCCKSFLGDNNRSSSSSSSESFYQLLGVERDASQEEIKRAYKRKSLQMHPDKLVQRGRPVTKEDEAKFTRMKEAYECLMDPHKRETYDAIGEKGMKWLDEPTSMDPQELARNFTQASILDRSKIFAIFVAIAVAVLALPVAVCWHVDGVLHGSWMATLIPLWLGNCFVLFYHLRVITMPNIERPEDIPPEEWIDPLPPRNQRILSLVRFLLLVVLEVLVALKLDNALEDVKWIVVFSPLLVWEATILYNTWPLASLRIITTEDLEAVVGKSWIDMTLEEKESMGKSYKVVASTSGPDFQAAQEERASARQDLMKSFFRVLFLVVLVIQIDTTVDWNWWLIFLPFWIMTFLICVANCQAFAEIQLMAEQHPELFGASDSENTNDEEMGTGTSTTNIAMGGNSGSNIDYGSVGRDGEATPEAASAATFPRSELSDEEKQKLQEEVMASSSTFCMQCCSQGSMLIIAFLLVAKLQGASFSSLWLISPVLFAVSSRAHLVPMLRRRVFSTVGARTRSKIATFQDSISNPTFFQFITKTDWNHPLLLGVRNIQRIRGPRVWC